MYEVAELLLISSVKFIDRLSGFLNSKQALNDGTTSSREVLELSTGRKTSVAFWILAIIVAASFWIWRLGRYQHKQKHRNRFNIDLLSDQHAFRP